jgi:type VI secretion system protein ImpK
MQNIIQYTKAINYPLQCCVPLFLACRAFLGDASAPENFREKISGLFVELEQQASLLAISQTVIASMKYALAAFIDETVLNSAWPYRVQWMGHPLQSEYFGEHLAGEGFFQRLNQLRQSAVITADLLEVYGVCLELGFQGVYKLRGEEQLSALQIGLRDQIKALRGPVESNVNITMNNNLLTPSQGNNNKPHHDVTIPLWLISIIIITLVFLIYFFYAAEMATQTRQALKQIQQNADLLSPSPLLLNLNFNFNKDVSHD